MYGYDYRGSKYKNMSIENKKALKKFEIIDLLAEYAHDSWAGWMEFIFDKSVKNKNGSVTIPKSLVDRWERQLSTNYHNLPEKEKESDIKEAAEIMLILYKYDNTQKEKR